MKTVKTVIGIVVSLALVVLLANPQILPLGQATAEKMQELELQHFLIDGSQQVTLAHILTLILAIAAVVLVYLVLKLILGAIGKRSAHAQTVCSLLAAIVKYLAIIVGVVWGFSIMGVNAVAVLAGVGIIGLILGFGAQSLIEDVITGIFIIFEGQYGIGDIIILDDFRGVVRSIGVRTTTIEDAGRNLKIVNNSDIRKLQNRSANTSVAITDVTVGYATNMVYLENSLAEGFEQMFAAHPDLYLARPRLLGVQELADAGMKIRIAADCKEDDIFKAQRTLNRDIKVLFEQKGIEIAYPQMVVHRA